MSSNLISKQLRFHGAHPTVEVSEASEVAEAAEINEAGEGKSGKSLVRTSAQSHQGACIQ